MDQAHFYSKKGEEYEDLEQWEKAYQAHKASAEHFLKLLENNQDPIIVNALSGLWVTQTQKTRDCKVKAEIAKNRIKKKASFNNALSIYEFQANHPENIDQNFENFWSYIDHWASNPIAFTTTNLNSDQKLNTNKSRALDSYYIINPNAAVEKSNLTIENKNTSGFSTKNTNFIANNDRDSEITGNVLKSKTLGDIMPPVNSNSAEQLDSPIKPQFKKLESALLENNILKSSIINFKNDFKQHAKLFFESKIKEITVEKAPIESKLDIETKLSEEHARIQALQQEMEDIVNKNANLQLQLKQQDEILQKYKNRWEKLVNSAKKKQAAKLEQSSK
ncbi:hypothetical protein BB561_000660 [Smittium simulii]|uniref:Uncharacterized protein n=1 Tax=Smittium simulii TaxID=133385 RepID=A0A2T9YY49_9FUNG|nr:hypothetical protein BB561_000660 [Smittium simulii]